jgi:PAS domain-containing protein
MTDRMSRLQITFEYLWRDRLIAQLQQEVTLLSVDDTLQAALVIDDQSKVVASAHLADRQRPVQEVLPSLSAEDQARRDHYLQTGTRGKDNLIYLTRDRRSVIGIYPLLTGADSQELRPDRLGFLYVQFDLIASKERQQRLAFQQALQAVGFWAGLALLFWVVAHFLVTRRVDLLLRITRQLAAGDYTARSGLTGGDELGVIGRAFDGMAAQLDTQRRGLQQSKERLDLALKAARMITWETTQKQQEVNWSDNLGDVLGGKSGDPQRHAQVTRLLLPMIKQCSADEVEERVTLEDGSEYWLACRGKVYGSDEGRSQRLSGVIWDVTERHHATEALQMLAETRVVGDVAEFPGVASQSWRVPMMCVAPLSVSSPMTAMRPYAHWRYASVTASWITSPMAWKARPVRTSSIASGN